MENQESLSKIPLIMTNVTFEKVSNEQQDAHEFLRELIEAKLWNDHFYMTMSIAKSFIMKRKQHHHSIKYLESI